MFRKKLKRLIAKFLDEQWEQKTALFFVVTLGVCALLYAGLFASPWGFPKGETVVSIEEGMGLKEIGTLLKEKSIIRSSLVFQSFVILTGGERAIKRGDYAFLSRQNVFKVGWRLVHGKYDIEPKRVFIPEGATAAEIAILAAQKLPHFDKNIFLDLAHQDEGYLFPDTYFFLPSVDEKTVYQTMRDTFNQKIARLEKDIRLSGHSLHEIITMASLLEEEAKETNDRKVISGILWKRIEAGIPLQVDAVFLYINGKNTFQLTRDDLAMDHLYNTYKYKGLPPGPISNPGLDAIEAALWPVKSPYFFYLSDLESKLHFARDFEEHKANRKKYLP